MTERYDAGLLNDFGGGDVDWWMDYIRAELDRAHDFYTAHIEACNSHDAIIAENERLREALEQIADTPNAGWMIARAALGKDQQQ